MLQRVFVFLFGMLLIASFTFTTSSEASCGSANCFLVTGTQEGIANPGQVIFDLSYRWIPMDKVQSGSHSALREFHIDCLPTSDRHD